MTEETTTTTEERPCFVRHEDAGGPCGEPASIEVYGLNFCEAHGEEAQLGARREERAEIAAFVDRFGADHSPVGRALLRLEGEEWVSGNAYLEALVRAYPAKLAPADVRERIIEWEAGEEPGYQGVVDTLLASLATLHKLMRIAHEEREPWLVELLERQRESLAAEAAYALERDEARESVRSE